MTHRFKLALLVVAFALLHECGHVAAAWFFRVRVKKIGFCWQGPYNQRERSYGWKEAAICLAGPAVNLFFVAAFRGDVQFANLVLLVVNLVMPHSDGRNAIAAMSDSSMSEQSRLA